MCQDGFMLSGDECVPMSHCGCSHHGVYYKEGETFYPTQQEVCQCLSGGTVECQNTSCPDGDPGKVIDGVFQCPSQVSSTCVATGDCTYVTFDGMAFNITGTCSYILTQTCTGDNLTSFIVTIQKEARQKGKVSGIQALSVEVYGVILTLKQGKRADVMVRWHFVVQISWDPPPNWVSLVEGTPQPISKPSPCSSQLFFLSKITKCIKTLVGRCFP